MLARLERRLELLTSGSRDAPSRHRALRDTIDWSVELLDEDEKTLFRRLSVFVGGCTLEAVEEVCGGDLDALGSLVDKSLVRADGVRFGMLETIREYAGELLDADAEAEEHPARACRSTTFASSGLRPRVWPPPIRRAGGRHSRPTTTTFVPLCASRSARRQTRQRVQLCALALALLVGARIPQRGTALARGVARRVVRGVGPVHARSAGTASSRTTKGTTTGPRSSAVRRSSSLAR